MYKVYFLILTLLFTASYCASSYLNRPLKIDFPSDRAMEIPNVKSIGLDNTTGVQFLEFTNSSDSPAIATYKVLPEYLEQFDEKNLVKSPLIVPAKKTMRVAEYFPKKGVKQTGLGFSNFNMSLANNRTNISSVNPYTLPIKVESLVLQAPKKDHRNFWMKKYDSHVGVAINAIDFDVPIGTPVYAIASGLVVTVHEASNFGCKVIKCAIYGNQLEVLHDDGSLAIYTHLKQEGVVPKLGDRVLEGQLVAYSGDTGGGGLPHLHLAVNAWQYGNNNIPSLISLPMVFKGKNNEKIDVYEGEYINAASFFAKAVNSINQF